MLHRHTNLVELSEASCRAYGDRPIFGTKTEGPNGSWTWLTYRELQHLIDAFRAGLASLGVGEGDRVAIVSNNRTEWAVAAYATYGLGATFVPLYEAQRPDEWEFILRDCGAKVAIGSKNEITETLEAMKSRLPSLEHVIGLERGRDVMDSYKSLLDYGRAYPLRSVHPSPESVAGFIYTSGTTGKPKGVMLTHGNITSNIHACLDVFPVAPDDRTLSFLPWAHAYGQVIELHGIVSAGASTAFVTDLKMLVEELAEVHPTMLIAVPRIFNKIYARVNSELSSKPKPLRLLFKRAIRTASRTRQNKRVALLDEISFALADRTAFAKIRRKFGGRLKYAISGSAALGLEVAEFVDALGIQVYEGYGLTETAPIVSANYPGARKLGSVGKPIPNVRVTIDTTTSEEPGRGEIVVHGPNVMKGYYNRPDENAKAFTPDGGLRTGDIGYLDEDGFLFVTGRIKEQYKLENGKYVMPSPLEEMLKLSPYITNVMLEGTNRPFNVAVIAIDAQAVRSWAKTNGVELGASTITTDRNVNDLIRSELERLSGSFRGFEVPRGFILTTEDFSCENGMLTPTLKTKRRAVLARYGAQLEALYGLGAVREADANAP